MAYQLGVDLGTTYTAAAVHRDGRTAIVELGGRTATIPSVVFLREDHTILTGEAAERRAAIDPERVAREFKRRVGDPTPILLGGTPYSADMLMSKLLRWVVDHVTQREGGAPSTIAVTHPANWGPFKTDLLTQAIRNADLEHAVMITEPEAAAIHYSSLERVEVGTLLGVYDLGGGTFDAAVLRKTEGGFELMGSPEGIERLGGIDFDESVFSHVRRSLDGLLEELDPDDANAMAAVVRLRRETVDAKEALSGDTEASIPVMLPNAQTDVRITRSEFESMIRPSLQETVRAMKRAFRSAGVAEEDVSAVLLVGGSSRIPLVAQMVGAEIGRPIALDVHPKHAIALGAAMVAADSEMHARGEAGSVADSIVASEVPIAAAESEPPTETPADAEPAEPESAAEEPPVVVEPEPSAKEEAPAKRAAVSPAVASSSSSPNRTPVILGIGGALVLIIIVLVVVLGGGSGSEPTASTTTEAAAATTAAPTTAVPTTAAPTTAAPTTAAPTTAAPTTTLFPVGLDAVRIISVGLEGSTYIVAYDTNYDPLIASDPASRHIHFYWDVYAPATVGLNEPAATRGDWQVWDLDATGAKSFDGFTVGTKPSGATEICALPATFDHQVANLDRVDEAFGCMVVPV